MIATGYADLLDRARLLAGKGERYLLGITGSPGAGKSTLADRLVADLGGDLAVGVPMDGFHYAQVVLDGLGRRERKGAQDTFDAGGFVALLQRLRRADEDVVYAPEFRREIEEPVGSAIAVPRSVPLLVVEGNYLLLREGAWAGLEGLIDETWFLEPGEDTRHDRLVARHMRFGRSLDAARARSFGSDEANAHLVAATRARADLVVTVV